MMFYIIIAAIFSGNEAFASSSSCATTIRGGNSVSAYLGIVKPAVLHVFVSDTLEYTIGNDGFHKLWSTSLVSSLPSWLDYDSSTFTLHGVPQKQDVGSVTVEFTISSPVFIMSCDNNVTMTLSIVIADIPTFGGKDGSCFKPSLVSPIDEVKATIGRPFMTSVACQFFQTARDMPLNLSLPYAKSVGDDYWLKLDRTGQMLYGIPLKDSPLSHDAISLVTNDNCGHKIKDALRLNIDKPVFSNINHNFSMTFDPALEEIFSSQEDMSSFIIGLFSRLEEWLGLPGKIYLVNIDTEIPAISWILQDIATTLCDWEYLNTMLNKMVDQNSSLLQEFNCFMGPLYPVASVTLNSTQLCDQGHHVMLQQVKQSSYKSSFDHWLEIVLPCTIFVVLVTLIIIIAMICSSHYPRSKRKYILQSEEHTYLEERNPIIFPNECHGKDFSLSPRPPVMLSGAPEDEDLGVSTPSLLIEGSMRNTPQPPDYHTDDANVPPPYRLPPPYLSSHSNW